jgi:hypothetical protein
MCFVGFGACVFSVSTQGADNSKESSMQERILNKDFKTAMSALEENMLQKNTSLVCLSLKHPSLIIKLKAASALNKMGAKTAIPHLIQALEDNQVVRSGGTEVQLLQKELNEPIILALTKMTDKQVPSGKIHSDADIQNVINESKEWWEKNKLKYEKAGQ